MAKNLPANHEIADLLEQIADLLETQGDNPHRIRAYRQAASAVKDYSKPVAEVFHESGQEGLQSIPGIGEGIARIIKDYITTGKSGMLQNLQSEVTPADVLAQVPGIGEELSQRIVDQLEIKSLAELELAAHDGRLQAVEGFGERRIEAVKNSLAGMLSPSALRRAQEAAQGGRESTSSRPDVSLLLEVDQEYRRRSQAGELKKIAPKRFNPENKAWLPVMNTNKQGWSFTALFSNTKRAHELGKTNDWVVIYYEKDGEEKQATVVTQTNGPLKDKRVVRGREAECRTYYERSS
jgi:DNA polymerase (family X)